MLALGSMTNMHSKRISDSFKGKTVIVTGHTGFKGAWLVIWLKKLGANVVGIALDAIARPSLFNVSEMSSEILDHRIDVRDSSRLEEAVLQVEPDFVFHMAAQALVRKAYADPRETWQTNVLGTLNLLETLRKVRKRCAVVIVTSDKCYDNKEWVWGYRENDALGGLDPYSASKAAAEMVVNSQVKSFFQTESSLIRIASARAGNVIGGGDWSLDRIVPDCVRSWEKGEVVGLRNPKSTRPWQHVLEPLSGYLSLAIELSLNNDVHGESFNFGPQSNRTRSVEELVREMALYWDMVRWRDESAETRGPHESGLLQLNCDKAFFWLGWRATLDFEMTVKFTSEWYRSYYKESRRARAEVEDQVDLYTLRARAIGLPWAQ